MAVSHGLDLTKLDWMSHICMMIRFKVTPVLNQAPSHKDIWRGQDIIPCIVNLQARQHCIHWTEGYVSQEFFYTCCWGEKSLLLPQIKSHLTSLYSLQWLTILALIYDYINNKVYHTYSIHSQDCQLIVWTTILWIDLMGLDVTLSRFCKIWRFIDLLLISGQIPKEQEYLLGRYQCQTSIPKAFRWYCVCTKETV